MRVYYDDIAALKAALEGGKKDTTGGNSPSGGSGGGGGMTSNGKINTPSGGTAAVPEPILRIFTPIWTVRMGKKMQ